MKEGRLHRGDLYPYIACAARAGTGRRTPQFFASYHHFTAKYGESKSESFVFCMSPLSAGIFWHCKRVFCPMVWRVVLNHPSALYVPERGNSIVAGCIHRTVSV